MKIYKRNFINLLWSLILTLFGLLFVNFIIYWFINEKAPNHIWIFYIIVISSSLYFLYSSIFKENIKIEIDNKYLKYYENNILKEEIDLSKVSYGYKITNNNYINLYLYEDNNNNYKSLDCSPLGVTKFYDLIEEISKSTKNKDNIPEAKIIKKGDN